MSKIFIIFFALLILSNTIHAYTWDECINKYEKAKRFSDNTRLSYIYLKSTKNCLIKFKDFLVQNPDPEFKIESMNDNILMLDKYIYTLLPRYTFLQNNLEAIPKYLHLDSSKPIINKEYEYFKKFKNCNGVHANNKIYTAKHCKIKDSKNIHFDLSYINTAVRSKLEINKLTLNKVGIFIYYSMSKEGMFYNVLLKEKNCVFYKAPNVLTGLNTSLDYTDLAKKHEIRSNCLAIPSNSGGGVFQEGKLVGIISKTVFNKNTFLYSVVEPILVFEQMKAETNNP